MGLDMEKALIFTAVGTGLFFDDSYDKENHWRFTKPERTYETCAIVFNDFEPEPNTYDHIVRQKGLKWNIIPEVAKTFDWRKYDYIGCFDDDYTTDIQSMNESLAIARHYDFRVFHQSLTSKCSWPLMMHNPELFFTETDFIECGTPFFRNDMFEKLLPLITDYTNDKSEWGLDKIWCHWLETTGHVIHKNTIKHMRTQGEGTSYYTLDDAFAAMNYLLTDFYPKYVKENRGIENYRYVESQNVLKTFKLA